ncbi:homoserine O-acetyltransferase [Fictibacillus aquaticus]|uniref:Homoserine O-acetyltransferase n=1 Tax=Fictibacillus aquaticus TaxID=2021314 RepID=A0A235FGK5_9BACL|nr:homoserine O-acetyltransferase [Fictibacillus aquaticus]
MAPAPERLTGKVNIGSLKLDSGEQLHDVELAYEAAGNMKGPAILVCHALTGSHHAAGTEAEPGWWSGLIGYGKYVDTSLFCVVTFNVLGGCSGSTGPMSVDRKTGKRYRSRFPFISVRDMVRAQKKALDILGITELHAVIGGSLGGMQAFEWGVEYPAFMKQLFIFAATPALSDYGIAFNRISIEAIKNDPGWNSGDYEDGTVLKGLEIARMTGLVTYRTPVLFDGRFQREEAAHESAGPYYQVESYMNYQGIKLAKRFDANSYLTLLYAMNGHDAGRGRGGWEEAAKLIRADLYAFGFEGDILYDPETIKDSVQAVPNSTYVHVNTHFGHDGFLTQFEKWGLHVEAALNDHR